MVFGTDSLIESDSATRSTDAMKSGRDKKQMLCVCLPPEEVIAKSVSHL